jgi:hypothetical protein
MNVCESRSWKMTWIFEPWNKEKREDHPSEKEKRRTKNKKETWMEIRGFSRPGSICTTYYV